MFFHDGFLNFNLGAGFNLKDFSQQIKIFRNRRFGSDPIILDKYLNDNELNVQSTTNASAISIDLNGLGINLPSKVRVILNTEFLIGENNVLNKNEITTSASANWVFR